MIRHYLTVCFTVDDDDNAEMFIDHAFLLDKVGGIAFDTNSKRWLTPSQLSPKDTAHDGEFVNFVAHALMKSLPDGATADWEAPTDNTS